MQRNECEDFREKVQCCDLTEVRGLRNRHNYGGSEGLYRSRESGKVEELPDAKEQAGIEELFGDGPGL